jgi:putative intracellular protease/amidase
MSLNLSKPGRPIEAGVILMGVTEILDVIPIDFLGCIGKDFIDMLQLPDEVKATSPEVNFHWVTEKGEPARMTGNMTIQATVTSLPPINHPEMVLGGVTKGWYRAKDSFESCPTLDIVLIGAYLPGYTPTPAELAFIAKSHDTCTVFLTVCGGFLAPQMAGVLAGKTATAPRFMVPQLQQQDPRTTWVEKRFVRDGKTWTSGALLNGQDMMRAFMSEHWPELTKVAEHVGAWPVRDVEYKGAEGLLLETFCDTGSTEKVCAEYLARV